MYDKTVRRRRAVLAVLVVSSLILLTVYFGESAGGGLHSIQRGAVEIVAPVQDVASRALKPVRDLVGWFDDTFHAKGDVERLRKERDELRLRIARMEAAIREQGQLEEVRALMQRAQLEDVGAVTARMTGFDPNLWYSQLQINKGSDDGVAVDQPVINGQGLVGVISSVTSDHAMVRLLTDHRTAVTAMIAESGVRGVVQPEAGRPTEVVLEYTRGSDVVEEGQMVVTAGARAGNVDTGSLFPPNIPIGVVTRVDNPGSDEQTVHLRPFVDPRRVETVQVLTKTGGERTR